MDLISRNPYDVVSSSNDEGAIDDEGVGSPIWPAIEDESP